jgi:hypothetical protein
MVVLLFRVMVQGPVPEHPPPDHPVKVDPDDGAAVNVTLVPSIKDALQVEPQSIPAGVLVTVPVPVPDLVTWRNGDPSEGEYLKTPPPQVAA